VTNQRVPLGTWQTAVIYGREIAFLPVGRLSAGDQARRLPHSLRVAAGFVRHVRSVPEHVPLQVHRLDTGAVLALRYPHVGRIQFIHTPTGQSVGANADSFWRYAPQAKAVIERIAFRGDPEVFVFNKPEAERLQAQGVRATRWQTWFDPEIHFPVERTRAGRLAVVWVGRLERPKDPVLAIRAFGVALAGGAVESLTIVGDGTLRPDVEREIDRLGLRAHIKLEGTVSRTVVADQLRRADVLLMTSHFEGSPRALVEALACGTPVACTTGANPDSLIVTGANGSATSTRTPEALAASVRPLSAPVAVSQLLGQGQQVAA